MTAAVTTTAATTAAVTTAAAHHDVGSGYDNWWNLHGDCEQKRFPPSARLTRTSATLVAASVSDDEVLSKASVAGNTQRADTETRKVLNKPSVCHSVQRVSFDTAASNPNWLVRNSCS